MSSCLYRSVAFALTPVADGVNAEFTLDDERDASEAIRRARALFGLDADPRAVVAHFDDDPHLGPLILAAPVYLVLFVVVQALVFVILGGASADTNADGDNGGSFTAGLDAGGFFILQIVTFVFGIFVQEVTGRTAKP